MKRSSLSKSLCMFHDSFYVLLFLSFVARLLVLFYCKHLLDISPFNGAGCRTGGDDCFFTFAVSECSSTEPLDFIRSERLIAPNGLSCTDLFSGELATVYKNKDKWVFFQLVHSRKSNKNANEITKIDYNNFTWAQHTQAHAHTNQNQTKPNRKTNRKIKNNENWTKNGLNVFVLR